jgi:hypothetical protein
MNDKIYSLRVKAVTTIEIVNPDTGITHHREFFDEEKFAELIIQECIELNRQELSFNAFARMLDKYKKHFGVEK